MKVELTRMEISQLDTLTVFRLSLGNKKKMLHIGVVLDDRSFDHINIAKALREVADELENADEADRESEICVKGLARKDCPYNPKLGCDCGYRKAL